MTQPQTTSEASTKERRERIRRQHMERAVARFKVSSKGLRRVFEKHFGDNPKAVEALVFHLARLEATLPNTNDAIRLARYPGAGDKNPKRMALGLWETLSVLEGHVRGAREALEDLVGIDEDSYEEDEDSFLSGFDEDGEEEE
jgi:hypothetical protein